MKLYEDKSGSATRNAQLNLMGRSHYVDPDTLRFHKSKVLKTVVTDNGLLLALVESYAADYEETDRRFRGVIFDICGGVIVRPKLMDGSRTRRAAEKLMWKALNGLDAVSLTLQAIDKAALIYTEEAGRMRNYVLTLR